jgi:hypothetical protein
MESFPSGRPDIRNPKTHERYRRQVWLQIFLPLGLLLLLLAVVSVFLWPRSPLAASAYADTALVFLILPVMLFGVIALAVVVAAIYLLVMLLRRIPEPAYQVQLALDRVKRKVSQGADLAARPFVRLSAIRAALGAIRLKRNRD